MLRTMSITLSVLGILFALPGNALTTIESHAISAKASSARPAERNPVRSDKERMQKEKVQTRSGDSSNSQKKEPVYQNGMD